MNSRSIVRSLQIALTSAVMLTASGCTQFSEWMSFEDGRPEAQAEASRLWEMTLMAGRYGAMLAQAREILNLPDPKPAGDGFPAGNLNLEKQRAALAAYQVSVAQEFAGDVARACSQGRLPKSVRAHACSDKAKLPDELRAAAKADTAALAQRNDKVGEYVTPWWDAVCDTAPKPKDGTPACPME